MTAYTAKQSMKMSSQSSIYILKIFIHNCSYYHKQTCTQSYQSTNNKNSQQLCHHHDFQTSYPTTETTIRTNHLPQHDK